ncbi:MAG: nucleotidyltransferase domain-containing protein [Rhodospirillales bacterium]|nr:nucleotidyltransferase domain-containing protein [Rhodospirillales bacterium]
MIDVTPSELSLVQTILHAGLPPAHVFVFGSRSKGTAKPASDLDLAVDAGAALTFDVMAHLAAAFEEAPLPYNIDIVDLNAISPEFRALIDAHKIALPGFE